MAISSPPSSIRIFGFLNRRYSISTLLPDFLPITALLGCSYLICANSCLNSRYIFCCIAITDNTGLCPYSAFLALFFSSRNSFTLTASISIISLILYHLLSESLSPAYLPLSQFHDILCRLFALPAY
ncbi:hypothetical protein [Thermoplasma acidophilum]|uniref:Uncharacterized protein n=1 Tax=Thermoplasma acidophilum (strain ATCC 25905 / DSM 1728 / JCM 9062 / NBRC 15155 / AMRC-C165) TaxID=273075 RepID=Q9HL62_THEAC|nr:hypothetical protein [Thermoplasma acidophilum]